MNNEIFYVYLDDVLPNRFQPRKHFDEKELNDLAESIRQHGVIQPLIVRRLGEKYEIIAGERRYKASTLAGLDKVPVIIKEMDDKDAAEVALIENVQRQNLTAIEEAESYNKLINLSGLTQEQIAGKVGVNQSTVANKLRLLGLTPEVKEALLNKKISERHARSLLKLSEPIKQNEMLDKIISEKLPVRIVDELINGGPKMNQEQNINTMPKLEPVAPSMTEQQSMPTNNMQPVVEAPIPPAIEPIEIPTLGETPVSTDDQEGETGGTASTPVPTPVQNSVSKPVVEAPMPPQPEVAVEVQVQPQMPTIEVATMPKVEKENDIFRNIPEMPATPELPSEPVVQQPVVEAPMPPQPEVVAEAQTVETPSITESPEQPVVEENKNKYVNTPEQQPTEIKTNIESIINEFKQKSTPQQAPMSSIPAEVEQRVVEQPIQPTIETTPTSKDVMAAVESIKQRISENVEKGYKIVVEDFDFKRSYQMIVKIEKE